MVNKFDVLSMGIATLRVDGENKSGYVYRRNKQNDDWQEWSWESYRTEENTAQAFGGFDFRIRQVGKEYSFSLNGIVDEDLTNAELETLAKALDALYVKQEQYKLQQMWFKLGVVHKQKKTQKEMV